MKRQIRRGVFETNSSSTHSVSIYKGKELQFSDIPKNSQVICNDSYPFGTDIYDEVGKLNYIITMISSIMDRKHDNEEISEDYQSFENMITYKYFEWIKELIKNERNTEIVFEKPAYASYFPYYDTTYDEYNDIYSILSDNGNYDLDDKEQFMNHCKEIIFDKDIRIEDKENEY